MQVVVNGNNQTLDEAATVQDLIGVLALGSGKIAIELNREIVSRSRYSQQILHAGDEVEIVQAIGGG
ncbi:MAG: sulfur carrier protein ThiS [Gammaproteobacteria bacterium]|jgi:thiamine biosynthesis protein ThiS|nr:sulfur carrier protein ThiS [Gammaproteobacteria bacterium]HJO10895.1 sulfur carrier protein ThiS [Gammaproteobacteria bacterium]|tara:strand:- start:1365 stop:1565 length:201 start_codon:yes stop_codon:yes gene_type:complete